MIDKNYVISPINMENLSIYSLYDYWTYIINMDLFCVQEANSSWSNITWII